MPLRVVVRAFAPVTSFLTLVVGACTTAATSRGELSPPMVSPPTVADLVDNHLAFLKLDRQHTSIGASFQMHYLSTLPNTWQSGTAGHRDIVKVHGTYYMTYEGSGDQPYTNTPWSSGFAASTDLLHWTLFARNPVLPPTEVMTRNDGPTFLSVGGLQYIYYRAQPEAHDMNESWRALITNEQYGGFDQHWSMSSPAIRHAIGRLAADGAWSVQRSDAPNHVMQAGPDVPMPVGDNIATWKLMIENNTADTEKIVRLEVVDTDAGDTVLSQRDLRRNQWTHAQRYEYFSVPFRLTPTRTDHRIALRVWYYGGASVTERVVGIS